jgi:seryl-tRNA synthetase
VKGFAQEEVIEKIISLDEERRNTQYQLDSKQAEMNRVSKEIGQLFKEGKKEEANKAKELTGQLKEEIKQGNARLGQIDQELRENLLNVPNLPHESVPVGKSENDNEEVKVGGRIPELFDEALPHWELAKKYDLIDFDLGNKITGAGFPVYKKKGAKLQRALISYFLDQAIEAGYQEVMPPLLVNEDSGYGTGQLPDKEGQMYGLTDEKYFLIPTAEVPVTNLYRDLILPVDHFPVKNAAYTPCFRREAGSYGKDVRGLNRLHQFDKVEIVQVQHPDKSYETLDEMVTHVEMLVQSLELPYRIMRLCGADLGFASALTYDFEVYSVAQKKWLEVSSVSNFESFQANRLKLRFKEAGEKRSKLAHTLNGSALALPRVLAALLENNQTAEGIKVPSILVPYTGFDIIE